MSGLEEFHCEEQSSEFTYKFEAGEKVLCFHGPLIYEAKCQQVRICEETKKPEYLIHYFGWNKSYDEWVAESRILKFNESNVKKQKELERALPKVKERKFRRKGVSSECKESKNSDSSSQSSSSNSSSHSGSSNVLSEEISQPRLVIERHLTPDESTPENSIRSELKEDGNGETNDEQEHIKQENNGGDDECVVDIKIENESITGYFEGDVKSSDKESKRISQRRSSRLSVESRTSSQELETPIKEEFDVSDSSQNFIDERFENEKDPTNSDDQAERGFPLTQSNVKLKNSLIDRVELEKPIDTAAKIERRRCSAKSDNGSSSSETGSDKPKRRSSVDTKKSVSEEAQQKSSARNDPKVDLLNMDPRKSITPRPANSIFRERRLFKLPKKLRTYLTDDWDFVCRQHKRTAKQLKNFLGKYKNERKKKLAAARKERFLTGGGSPPAQDPTQDPTVSIFAFADSDTVALSNVGETQEFEIVEVPVLDKDPPKVDDEPSFEPKELLLSTQCTEKRKQTDIMRHELEQKVKRARTLNRQQEIVHTLIKEKHENEMELARIKMEEVQQEMRHSEELFLFDMSRKDQEAKQSEEASCLDLARKKQDMEQSEKAFLAEMAHKERKWELELQILRNQ